MNKNKSPKNPFIQGAIPPEKIASSIASHQSKKDIGAHSIFLGQIRNDNVDGKQVVAIEYTSNEELSIQEIARIREEIFTQYPITCMHIYHSLGRVEAGEICFFVFTSSAHRTAAIDACEALVNKIKSEVPIWGMEIFEDDTHQWKENT